MHARSCVLTLLLTVLLLGPATAQSPEPLLSNVRQLTLEGKRSGEGYFSSDGKWMVFQSEREPGNPFYQIYLLDVKTGVTRRVSTGAGKTTCSWIYPDRQHVLFASTHLDPDTAKKQQAELDLRASGQKRRYAWDYDEHYDLFEASLAGGTLRNLTNARGYDAEACVSPDGRTIVFASNRHAYTGLLGPEAMARFQQDPSSQIDVYAMNVDGTDVRRLTTSPGYDGGPFFSADGKRICWRRFSGDGATAEIHTMAADGSDPRQLTRMGAMSWAPYFHPSGDYLVFATNKQGFANFELYLVDAAGKHEPVRVTETDGFDGLPVFTPDGRHLAWTSGRTEDKTSQIFMAGWDDAAARRLLGLDGEEPVAESGPSEADLSRVRGYVERLASDEMDGRLTGTAGEQRATTYVADVFKGLGLQPAGDQGGWLQAFPFTAGVKIGPGNVLTLASTKQPATVDVDWRPLPFSATGTFDAAPVVFAGYGLVAPAHEGLAEYDSYVHLDVKGKWVLAFRYVPEGVPAATRQHLSRFSGLRYKAMMARDRGARGLILVSGPNASVKEQLVKLGIDASLAGSSMPAISVTDALAARILEPSGKSLKALQDALDSGAPSMGFVVPGQQVAATVDIVQEKRTGHNVLAILKAEGNTSHVGAGEPRAQGGHEVIVIGAHLDHLGHGVDGNSLARGDEKGKVHYGADDNASGVAGLLEIARTLSQQRGQLKRDVLFCAWSGEELGILGSSYFAKMMPKGVVAYLNMDMIGRFQKTLVIQGVGSSSFWKGAVERANAPLGIPLALRDESYLPTDATSFYLKGIPILSAFTGAHSEYHTPRDVASAIDYGSLVRIETLIGRVAEELADGTMVPDYKRMEKPAAQESRAGLRAYLGTIPDYAQGDIKGVKLSGVSAKGPAEAAGVQAGDVIVELAGRKIDNIYDYTYALEALKIGQPVKLVVLRGDKRVELTVTPGSRE